ncbi:MAG TPA: SGNH/GDSL hydrolase family protein [Flavisolibacter sp.]|nr:SGNH/GDSL hydrolase family protein [Flavisolibacter sp.]
MKWLFLLILPTFSFAQKTDTMHHTYTYLALGDSYTIGESVPLHKSFPYQTVSLLRKDGYHFMAPEIIAKTGWTTDELESGMSGFRFLPKYDFVTLLIGVNNQYRGRGIIEYKEQFENLLKKSIAFAGGKPEHVIVLSIPDYGVTPFGGNKNPEKIAKEIDEYNTLNKAISIQYKVHYLDITQSTRKAKAIPGLVAADGLHPSEKEYAEWAKQLAPLMKEKIKK